MKIPLSQAPSDAVPPSFTPWSAAPAAAANSRQSAALTSFDAGNGFSKVQSRVLALFNEKDGEDDGTGLSLDYVCKVKFSSISALPPRFICLNEFSLNIRHSAAKEFRNTTSGSKHLYVSNY